MRRRNGSRLARSWMSRLGSCCGARVSRCGVASRESLVGIGGRPRAWTAHRACPPVVLPCPQPNSGISFDELCFVVVPSGFPWDSVLGRGVGVAHVPSPDSWIGLRAGRSGAGFLVGSRDPRSAVWSISCGDSFVPVPGQRLELWVVHAPLRPGVVCFDDWNSPGADPALLRSLVDRIAVLALASAGLSRHWLLICGEFPLLVDDRAYAVLDLLCLSHGCSSAPVAARAWPASVVHSLLDLLASRVPALRQFPDGLGAFREACFAGSLPWSECREVPGSGGAVLLAKSHQ